MSATPGSALRLAEAIPETPENYRTRNELLGELRALAAYAAEQIAHYQALTNQAQTSGVVFDFNAPLPPMRTHRRREWDNEQEQS